MAALASVLITVTVSLIITRIGTQALAMTGLSRPLALFQARSAFTGAGFTTSESEQVVDHPVRRRIIMWLMFLGNVGIVTVISSLVLTFISIGDNQGWVSRFFFLVIGLSTLWVVATNQWVDRIIEQLIAWALHRWTQLQIQDYANLLQLSGDYGVRELKVKKEDWLANQSLKKLNLFSEGVAVLGIYRCDGTYIGVPRGSTSIRPQDTLVIYGRLPDLEELDSRRTGILGEQAHERGVRKQKQVMEVQDKKDVQFS
ncbi:hypothetical protein cce_1992 [Crocosphaera subtropica ATCC 51142]|uniref:RCK C-terminal domain-containing protein n=1 Tax=Crocosphaera subtropica (strain ATCC 51142 / BH68) TaxID=43989 RepID=B1X1B3_CROS5|nr:TrkA C-terminal domain-containing protein [Crocosphaera subtropica]ACB51342.1 hypothetical protein cce_1992 [Crocosphaera subtropica ATCC 51142]